MSNIVTKAPFWKRPERWWTIALGAGAFYGLSVVAPSITAGVTSIAGMLAALTALSLNAALLIVAVLGVGVLWKSAPVISYLFQMVARKSFSMVIETNPIEIMRIHLTQMRSSFERLSQHLIQFEAERRKLEKVIEKNAAECDALKKQALAAKRIDDEASAIRYSTRFQLLSDSTNNQLQPQLEKMKKMGEVMQKVKNVVGVRIDETEFTIETATRERDALMASHGLMSEARGILGKNSMTAWAWEDAQRALTDDSARRTAEIKSFLDETKSLMQDFDINAIISSEAAMAQLEQWEQKSMLLENSPSMTVGVQTVEMKEKV